MLKTKDSNNPIDIKIEKMYIPNEIKNTKHRPRAILSVEAIFASIESNLWSALAFVASFFPVNKTDMNEVFFVTRKIEKEATMNVEKNVISEVSVIDNARLGMPSTGILILLTYAYRYIASKFTKLTTLEPLKAPNKDTIRI